MTSFIDKLKQKLKDNKNLLLFCLVSTFIMGLITHAYMYFQDAFSHDSLNELNGAAFNEWKIQLGRFLIPLYKLLSRGNITLPWVIGVYSLLWTGLAVFFTAKLFNIKSKGFIALIGAVYTANVTVIATTATYIHDLDVDMFALFLAVAAVYLWKRYRWGFLVAPLCVIGVLGLYQCYLSVVLVLVIFSLLLDLLNGAKVKTVLLSGLKAAAAVVVGGLVYAGLFRAVLAVGDVPELLNNYNSLDKMFSMTFAQFLTNIKDTYLFTCRSFFYPHTTLPKLLVCILTAAALVISGGVIVYRFITKKLSAGAAVLTVVLLAATPLMMNISRVLSNGMSHDLMHFAVWLVYLFVLLAVHTTTVDADEEKPAPLSGLLKGAQALCAAVVALVMLSNVMLANQLYLKKDLEQDAALTYFTRVVTAMENYEMYDRETDLVFFAGRPDFSKEVMDGFEITEPIIGSLHNYVMGASEPSFYKNYFEYKLHYRINVEPTKDKYTYDARVQEMPAFPEYGCMRMFGNTLVVKLG